MAFDNEILRRVWNGRIPVCFTLSPREICTREQPDPFYMMLPRISYFPLVIEKVIKHFSRFVTEFKQEGNDVWIDFDDIPLKWHYPIGLLWDLFASDAHLPWNLTLHFESFPEDELIRLNNRSKIEAMFIYTIKEADALKHNSQVMNALRQSDHRQLWLSFQDDKFDQFWSVNKKLMYTSDDEKKFRHIPLRIYEKNLPFIQKLIPPKIDETNEMTTVKYLLNNFCFSNSHLNTDCNENNDNVYLITHGVTLPNDTSLQWLSEHFSYPDNFLHICLSRK